VTYLPFSVLPPIVIVYDPAVYPMSPEPATLALDGVQLSANPGAAAIALTPLRIVLKGWDSFPVLESLP
jgi:hypothetical protein